MLSIRLLRSLERKVVEYLPLFGLSFGATKLVELASIVKPGNDHQKSEY